MQLKHTKSLKLNGNGEKVGIAVSRFNLAVSDGLLNSAKKALAEFGVSEKNIEVVSVAGAVELPSALQKLAESKQFDFLVALGCVIRGETPHFDYVANMAQQGTLRVMLDYKLPIGFGVLTVENLAQAKARLHVGGEAVAAALELALLKVRKLK
jgi:6,7-dimethyl-8-ribityllumazine synthase